MMRKREKKGTRETGGNVVKRNQRHLIEKVACIFCQKESGKLHEFRTLKADKSLRQMATDLWDTELITRIEGDDLVVLETPLSKGDK